MACIGAAILVHSIAFHAESQEVKRPGTAAGSAAGTPVERAHGAKLIDYGNDGTVDLFVASGLSALHQGWGIAVGDIDNDGRPDLFVVDDASRGKIYHNRGDGTFEEVSANPTIETIKIDGGKVEINGQSIKIEGARVEIIRRER
jgi:hypothetical protein